jgi:hypothetical protein
VHLQTLGETHHTGAFFKLNIFETTKPTKKFRAKSTFKTLAKHLILVQKAFEVIRRNPNIEGQRATPV